MGREPIVFLNEDISSHGLTQGLRKITLKRAENFNHSGKKYSKDFVILEQNPVSSPELMELG